MSPWAGRTAVKLRGVRQKVTVLHPKTMVSSSRTAEPFRDIVADGLSEAEQVILLHRDAKKFETKQPIAEKVLQ